MTEAEQVVEMERFVAAFDALDHNSGNTRKAAIVVKNHGDVKVDIIYSVGTLQRHVSAENLRSAKTAIAKVKANENICADPAMIELTSSGVAYQAILKDLSGTTLYESDVCGGAPASASEETSSTHKLRGRS